MHEEYSICLSFCLGLTRHTDLVGVHIRTLMEGQRGRARPHTFCIYMCVFQSQQVHRSIMPFHGDTSLW
jgi:hypothetical protein